MKIFQKILILSITLFLTGCEDVIDVNLDTAPPKLVIDASIDWVKNTTGNQQKILLSTTTGYYSDEFPTVSGASVIVTNASNTVFNFVETPGTGEYVCSNFEPVIGETYALKIVLNGETYTATETLTAVPKIEDKIDQNDEGGITRDEIEITYYYQDNGAEENFYLNSITIPEVAFPQYGVEDDKNSQGNLIQQFYSHEDLKAGDEVNIKIYGLSKSYYNYFNKLLTSTGNSSSPFPTTPSAVRGNIVNQTNNDHFAFGFFRLCEVDNKIYTVK